MEEVFERLFAPLGRVFALDTQLHLLLGRPVPLQLHVFALDAHF